jgi:hypothetical protein
VRSGESGSAWGSLVFGLASVVAVPVAVFLTRFSDSYDLLHAGLVIPVTLGLSVVALVLARRARRQAALALSDQSGRGGVAAAGRILAIVGLCVAASALIALGVFGLLEYVGSRD